MDESTWNRSHAAFLRNTTNGNPSPSTVNGREVRTASSGQERNVAELLNASPSVNFFSPLGGYRSKIIRHHFCGMKSHGITHALTVSNRAIMQSCIALEICGEKGQIKLKYAGCQR